MTVESLTVGMTTWPKLTVIPRTNNTYIYAGTTLFYFPKSNCLKAIGLIRPMNKKQNVNDKKKSLEIMVNDTYHLNLKVSQNLKVIVESEFSS